MNERLDLEYQKYINDPDKKKAALASSLSRTLRYWNEIYGDFEDLSVASKTVQINNETDSGIITEHVSWNVYCHEKFTFERKLGLVKVGQKQLQLDKASQTVLTTLINNENEVTTDYMLARALWPDNKVYIKADFEALKTHVSRIRRTIFPDNFKDESVIKRVRETGYILINPLTTSRLIVPGEGLEPSRP